MADERIQIAVKVLVFIVVVAGGTASLSPSPQLVSPPVDTSLCPPTDTLALCEFKLAECNGVSQLLTPSSGLVHIALLCANATSLPITHSFLATLRMAVLQGRPSAFFKPTASSSSLRQCILNATNLLDPNTLALNRTAVANRVQDLLPDLPALATAVDTCPEPVDFDATSFLTCLKRACMSSVTQSPDIAMAQPLLASSSPAVAKTISKPPAAILPFFIP